MRYRYRNEEEMKDSGVEWIGLIPRGWNILMFKRIVESVRNGVWGDEPQENKDDIPCIRILNFNRNKMEIDIDDLTTRNIPLLKQRDYRLKRGDLLIEKSGGGDKNPVGFVAIYNHNMPAVYANFMAKISLRDEIAKSEFVKYMCATIYTKRIHLDSVNQTTGIQNLDSGTYFKRNIAIPGILEQDKISKFLDEKTAQFDSIISKKEALIQRLEEAKKSLISEVVTGKVKVVKTSDGYELVERKKEEIKDSKVEWLGEIPRTFLVSKIKHVSDVIDPQPDHRAPKIAEDEGFPYIGIRDLNFDGTVNVETSRKVEEDAIIKQEKAFSIDKGDIVFGKVGTLGNPKFIQPHTRIALSATLVLIKCKLNISNRYLRYVLDSIAIDKQMQYVAQGSTRPALGIQQIRKFDIPYPNVDEQILIANYLDLKVKNIERLCGKTLQQVEKLKEAKQSLISEAVTGKIEILD